MHVYIEQGLALHLIHMFSLISSHHKNSYHRIQTMVICYAFRTRFNTPTDLQCVQRPAESLLICLHVCLILSPSSTHVTVSHS